MMARAIRPLPDNALTDNSTSIFDFDLRDGSQSTLMALKSASGYQPIFGPNSRMLFGFFLWGRGCDKRGPVKVTRCAAATGLETRVRPRYRERAKRTGAFARTLIESVHEEPAIPLFDR